MKQFLRHIFLLVAMFVATASLTAQTYNGGTWYSLYDANEHELKVTITSYQGEWEFLNMFPPVQTNLTFDAMRSPAGKGTLNVAPIVNGVQQPDIFSSNPGKQTSSFLGFETEVEYVSYSATVSNSNSNQIKFYTPVGATLSKHFKNIKLPLAKHILLYDDTDSKGMDYGTSSIGAASTPRHLVNLATAEGQTSTSYYTIKFRSFLATGDITITSSNPEFHFGNGKTSISLGVANNYCASANGSGNCSATTLGQISNYNKQVYFSPSIKYNKDTRSTTIKITDGTSTAYIYLSAPVIPTYFFKAAAIASPAEGGNATATFPNGQNTYSLVATDYATASMSAKVTFTATPNTANGYVFEGWKNDPASSTFYKQGADQTSLTETITSSALNPNGLESQLTYYAIYSRRYTAKITGSNYSGKLVNDSWQADYQFVNTQTAKPTNSAADPFYFVINHDFTGNESREGSSRPNEVIAYDPATNTITALNEGVATITFNQKETNSHEEVIRSYTVEVGKYTPAFTWNAANTPYYYGTSIPNIFSTTNPDVETTFTSDNEAFARVENNTLYIANVRETATITVSQQENYKWYSNSEQYIISPVNGNNHVQFTITSENYYNVFRYDNTGNLSWKNDGVLLGSPDVSSGALNYSDRYYDIVFTGIPDKLSFTYERSTSIATDCDWYVKESADGVTWSENNVWEKGNSNSGSVEVQLNPTTHYLRFCYSGNYGGYFRNIHVSERFQYEATPTAIDFGTNGINHGQQEEEITFLHANAGRITKALITGEDANYFTVNPELIPGTGRDLYGSAKLKVTFDNFGKDRDNTPYNATLVISDNSDKTEDIHIPLTGIRDGKSTPVFVWNPNAMPYYFNTTIANIAYSTNRDANCPLTFSSSDETIAKVENGDLYIYGIGQEVTITVSQPGNADFMPATETFTFTPCERPSLEVPFRVSQALHNKSVQLGTKCQWLDDTQIQMADPKWDGFLWGDARKRVLVTFAGVPDKLYFEFKYQSASSITPATPEDAAYSWIVEESPNGVDWTEAWKTSTLSTDWKSSGEIDLKPNTQFVRFNYKGNFAGYIRNIIISSLEGNSYLRAEEGGYLSRGAKWGTQAIVDPFGMVCRVSHFTVDNTNIYTRFLFIDNMQYLWETHDTKELFTDDQTAANTANLWQIESDASGKFTIQSGNNLGNKGTYVTITNNALTFTDDHPTSATIWHMETPAEHNAVVKNYMDAAAAKAAEKDFGVDINTLEKVRSSITTQDFEVTEIEVPAVKLAQQSGEYRDGINGTFDVYDDTISGLTPGFYRLTVKALYRISDSKNAQAAKTNDWESVLAYVYANDVKYPIQSVYASYNAGSYDTSDDIYNGYSYPAQLISAGRALEEVNRYLNDVYVYVEADPGQTTGTLHYGIKNPSYVPGAWLAYSTIKLTRFGRKEYIFQGTDLQDHTDWHTGGNWNRGAVPNQYHNVRISSDAIISTPIQVYGMTIDENQHLTITEKGGLTVGNGGVREAHDGCITIENLPEGAGFLRIAPNATNKLTQQVTVNYATMAYNSGSPQDEVWQYVGAPGSGMQMNNADKTLIYHWNEQKGWVKNSGTSLEPFVGYALTQDQAPRGNFEIIATPIFENKKIDFTKTQEGMNGDNLFVNSYLSPIDVARIDPNTDYSGIEGTFYLFNSGSWRDWQDGDPNSVTVDKSPGQYFAITPGSAALIDANEDQTTIPPMQGAYVIAQTNDAWINLDYKKHVYDVTSSMNRPMRAPQLEDENFMRVRLQLNSPNSGADRMYIIQYENTTRGYDNGYDAKNIIAQGQANIYTNEVDGQMEISVADQIDSTYIGFAAGEDSEYTLTFTSLVGQDMYLHDLETDSLFLLAEDQQYTFAAQPNSVNDMRFQLLLYPDLSDDQPGNGVTTGVDNTIVSTQLWVNDKRVYIIDAHQNSTLSVYTANGISVTSPLTIHHAPCTIDLSHLPTGVYVLRLNDQAYKFICK